MDTPPLAFVADHQTPGQKTGRQPKPNMRRRTTKPGQSGNPLDGGLLVNRQNEARKARFDELCAAFGGEFPNTTPFELVLISSAADLLERSERRTHCNTVSAPLSRNALRITDKLRAERRQREARQASAAVIQLQAQARGHAVARALGSHFFVGRDGGAAGITVINTVYVGARINRY
jgi:hypothetical protein